MKRLRAILPWLGEILDMMYAHKENKKLKKENAALWKIINGGYSGKFKKTTKAK
jgi:hypothetical protein